MSRPDSNKTKPILPIRTFLRLVLNCDQSFGCSCAAGLAYTRGNWRTGVTHLMLSCSILTKDNSSETVVLD